MNGCTLTGVDERTELDQLVELSAGRSWLEWGLLYSPKRAGQPGRYPGTAFLHEATEALGAGNVALHVCGSGVQDLLSGEPIASDLAARIEAASGRIQLNFNQGRAQLARGTLEGLFERHARASFILQYNEPNAELVTSLAGRENVHILFDASGGTGMYDEGWPATIPGSYCGYAGGLGPRERILEQLAVIHDSAAGARYWIDMESSPRVIAEDGVDWLSVPTAQGIIEKLDGAHGLNKESTDGA